MVQTRRFLVAGAAAVVLAGCGGGYDEAAHRDVVEAYGGGLSDAEWVEHRDATRAMCEEDSPLAAVTAADDQELAVLEMEVACPDRADLLPDEVRPE
jgi:hypothetical protein